MRPPWSSDFAPVPPTHYPEAMTQAGEENLVPGDAAFLPGVDRRGREVTRLRDISPQQWKSGIAAWLGWLFDGLDMHLYTLVATPFVAQLLAVAEHGRPAVGELQLAGSRRRSWSAGRWAAGSSAASATGWAAAGP